jgi:hypothetical protein
MQMILKNEDPLTTLHHKQLAEGIDTIKIFQVAPAWHTYFVGVVAKEKCVFVKENGGFASTARARVSGVWAVILTHERAFLAFAVCVNRVLGCVLVLAMCDVRRLSFHVWISVLCVSSVRGVGGGGPAWCAGACASSQVVPGARFRWRPGLRIGSGGSGRSRAPLVASCVEWARTQCEEVEIVFSWTRSCVVCPRSVR